MPPERESTPRLSYRLEYLLARAVVRVVESLPAGAAVALAHGVAALMHAVMRSRVRLARAQMGDALGLDPASREVASAIRQVMRVIAYNSLWLVRLPRSVRDPRPDARERSEPPELNVGFEGREHLEAERSRGRGIVFATAHLGNWEGLGAILPRLGVPVATVSRPMKNPLLQEWARRLREHGGQRLIPKDGAALPVARLLKKGGCVAFLIDQHAGSDGVRMPFFQAECSTFTSAATLARRFDAAFLPTWSRVIGPREARVHFEPAIPCDRSLPADEDAYRMTLRFNRLLEAAIGAAPGQFLWLHRRWKKGGREPDPAWRERYARAG